MALVTAQPNNPRPFNLPGIALDGQINPYSVATPLVAPPSATAEETQAWNAQLGELYEVAYARHHFGRGALGDGQAMQHINGLGGPRYTNPRSMTSRESKLRKGLRAMNERWGRHPDNMFQFPVGVILGFDKNPQ